LVKFLSVTPLVRREVLQKVPLVCDDPTAQVNGMLTMYFQLSSYYEDKTPASDKPF